MRRIQILTQHLNSSVEGKAQACSAKIKPVTVLVTGAAGNIGYALVFMIAQGAMLGPSQPVVLHLLDIPGMEKALEGLAMELRDGAFPLVSDIVCTSDYAVAFNKVDIAILVGAKPRGPGMERKDLLQANAKIFEGQGQALNKYASRNVKVLVVGNPANTNALICSKHAPDIPPQNITAMTRLDHSRAVWQIAGRTGVATHQVKNVIIWGNHSATQYPDVNHAVVVDHPTAGVSSPVRAVVNDHKWLDKEFVEIVQKRGAAIIEARKKSSAASAASAAVDHIRSWILGTPQGEWVSMAVPSDGSYGVPKEIVYSFPCTTSNGHYQIVQGLKLDDASRQRMRITAEELLAERKDALGY